MSRVPSKEIAYYGKPIETLTREELIRCIEELAGAINDCASQGKKCSDVIKIKTFESEN
jgi:hypothetical protein